MDEGFKLIQTCPWPIEDIPNDNFVYRQSITRDWEKEPNSKRRWPNEASFSLRENERGLSVNWDKYITIKNNFLLIGLNQKTPGRFLDPTSFRIFKFPVAFLRSLQGLENVLHNPVFHGNPSPMGKPNNRSHSLLMYPPNDGFIRMNLSDYCQKNYEDCYCNFEVNSIREELEELRNRLNDNPFHCLD